MNQSITSPFAYGKQNKMMVMMKLIIHMKLNFQKRKSNWNNRERQVCCPYFFTRLGSNGSNTKS